MIFIELIVIFLLSFIFIFTLRRIAIIVDLVDKPSLRRFSVRLILPLKQKNGIFS